MTPTNTGPNPEPTPPTTATSKPARAADRQGSHSDYAPHLGHITGRTYWTVHALIMATAIVSTTVVDTPLIRPAIDMVVGQDESVSWLVSALLMVIAAITAIGIGALHKAHQVRGGHRSALVIGISGWTALGLALFGIRYLGAGYSDVTAIVEGATASTGEGDQERTMAALLLAVYAASGALCYWAGHSLNMTVQQLIRERRLLRKLESEFTEMAGKLSHLTGIQLTKMRDVEAQSHLLYAANLSDAGVADLLHAHARKRIAIKLSDAAATGIVSIKPTTEPRTKAHDIPIPSTNVSITAATDK